MRRKDIDWLRIFGIILLFPFHDARIFDSREFNYIHSSVTSTAGEIFMTVLWPWFMPLLFLVAGISTWYALQKRDSRHYLKERVLRLFIPFLLGLILIVPIQGYVARIQQGTLRGGYFNFLFYQFFSDFSDLSGYHGTFTPAHLWFILYLFVISCVLLPLFIHIIKVRKQKGIGAIGKLFEEGWFLLFLTVPITITEALPSIGGKNPFFYGIYFTIGFLIASNEKSWKTIDEMKWRSLTALIISLPLFLYLSKFNGMDTFAWQSIILALVRNIYGISTLLYMLAFAQKHLNRGGKILDYMNAASFPVYILHQSVMMVLAYFILLFIPGMALQYIVILIATPIVCLALFEVFKRFPLLRFILGIK